MNFTSPSKIELSSCPTTDGISVIAESMTVDLASNVGSYCLPNRVVVTATTRADRNCAEKRKSIKQEMKKRYLKASLSSWKFSSGFKIIIFARFLRIHFTNALEIFFALQNRSCQTAT